MSKRAKPADFFSTYTEIGRDASCDYYRAHKTLINEWVGQSPGIKEARQAYVLEQRAKSVRKKPVVAKVEIAPHDPDDLHAACAYFREPRNGSWVCGVREDGLAYRGTRIMQPVDMISLALDKGMDEWYVEADIMKRIASHEGVDEWVLGNV